METNAEAAEECEDSEAEDDKENRPPDVARSFPWDSEWRQCSVWQKRHNRESSSDEVDERECVLNGSMTGVGARIQPNRHLTVAVRRLSISRHSTEAVCAVAVLLLMQMHGRRATSR